MGGAGLLSVLCAPSLGADAQLTLATTHDVSPSVVPAAAASVLASRPDLDPDAAMLLSGSKDTRVRCLALASVRDPGYLDEVAGSAGVKVLGSVARNPHAPPGLLSELARHPDGGVSLRALCNSSTPESVRRDVLSLPHAADLVRRRSPLGAEVVRAAELMLNNLWLAAAGPDLPPALLRAASSLPECPESILERSGRWRAAADHPVRSGRLLSSMDDSELASCSSSAAHLELLSRSSFSAAAASRVLAGSPREGAHELAECVPPEPQVVAGIFRRFGAAPLLYGVPLDMAGTRVATASWAEPFVAEAMRLVSSVRGRAAESLGSAEDALGVLGTDQAAWEVFVSLASPRGADPYGLADLARVSRIVSGSR